MKAIPRIVAIFSMTILSCVLFAQGPTRDGRWEITTEMDMPGMPMKMPAIKTIQCITKEQANDPNASVPKGGQDKNSDCKVTDYKTAGNTVTYAMKCEGKNAMTGNGEIVYAADTYAGWMKMKTADVEMTMKYKAKRLGDCVK